MTTAAAQLVGMTLDGGWIVGRILDRPEYASGGAFSQSYIAERNGEMAFLKALDFSQAFEPGKDTLKELGQFIASFENERDVLDHCKGKRLSHVTLAIGHGFVDVPGMNRMEGRVYYLLFEMADGDVRRQMSRLTAADALWCMEALRSVALGLLQVHRERIAHQDVKPSNVLAFGADDFKVADFGRASSVGRSIYYDDWVFPGDWTYAPPELQYGFIHPDFVPRRMGTDLYMLGNIAAFLFGGTNMTASIFSRLDPQHYPRNWGGEYAAVVPYLQEAFARALSALKLELPSDIADEIIAMIRQLCEPDLARRGHPRGIGKHDQYSLERYVSRLDHLKKELTIKERLKKSVRA